MINGNLSDFGSSPLGQAASGGLGQQSAEARCPNCGYCPHCGRSNTTPYNPWPYNPYPYTGPYYTVGDYPNVGTATCSGGNTQNRM